MFCTEYPEWRVKMNILKKKIGYLLVIFTILLTLSLTSCDVLFGYVGEGGGEGENTENSGNENENTNGESGQNPTDPTPGEGTEGGEEPALPEIDPPETLEEINEYRETARAEGLEELKSRLGDEAIAVLAEIYDLYDENLYIWLANLYDHEIGAFYYSNSARDNDYYLFYRLLPDIESTAQALEMLETTGLASSYGGKWANMLSDEIKQQLLDFTRGLQSTDGYFYHPQWGKSINTSRRGRDLGWSTQILRALGEPPFYNTPNGVSGIYSDGSAALAVPLGSQSTAQAVSKVVPAAVAIEFSSEENFKRYLDNLNINQNSYSAGNTLDARSGEINKAGLSAYLRSYLRDIQCDNGLWEEEISYNALNGLMKISPRFIVSDPFPNPEKAIESILSILNDEIENGFDISEIETICYIYNPWVALKDIKPFLSSIDNLLLGIELKDKLPLYLQNTLDKLRAFKKDDGGFSYYPGESSYKSQEEIVAVRYTAESDVNATAIAISTVFKHILPIFNVQLGKAPDLYTKYDAQYFLAVLNREEYYPDEK